MKIIFLNTWGGKVREAITDFIREQSADTDVFCFQEAYEEMALLARNLLPGFVKAESYKHVNDDDNFPQLSFIKNSVPLLSSGTIMEHESGVGLGLYVRFRHKNSDLYVCNFHGMSRPVDKMDDPGRIRQSEKLIEFFRDKPGSKIIGGDFNIFPETRSLAMLRENGYRDLVKEFHIATTRNRLAWEMYPGNKQLYSDYIFATPDLEIKNFSVPAIEISDHLPLILEIG